MMKIENHDSYNALKLDGRNYMTITLDPQCLTGKEYTIETAVCPDTEDGILLDCENAFSLELKNGYLLMSIGSAVVFDTSFSAAQLDPGEWCSISLVFSQHGITLYLNGFSATQSTPTASPDLSHFHLARTLTGYMSKLCIYKKALDESTVKANLYNSPAADGLILSMDFTNPEIRDTSGKNNSIAFNKICRIVNLTHTLELKEAGAFLDESPDWSHDLSINMMIYADDGDNDDWVLLNAYNKADQGPSLSLMRTGNTFQFSLNGVLSQENFDLFYWYNLSLVKDSTGCKLYVNGELAVTDTKSFSQAGDYLVIGSTLKNLKPQGATAFHGCIDYVAVFDTAITAQQAVNYTTTQPSILSPHIKKLYCFKDSLPYEAVTNAELSLLGDSQTIMKENVNSTLITRGFQCEIFEDTSCWDSLSEHDQWLVETYSEFIADEEDMIGIKNEYAGSKAWYMIAAGPILAAIYFSGFDQILAQGAMAPIPAETFAQFMTRHGRGGTPRALRRTRHGTARGLAAWFSTENGKKFCIVTGVVAGAAIIGGIIYACCKKEPEKKDKIQILEIGFRHGGDPSTGSVYLRKDHDTAYSEAEYHRGPSQHPFCYVRDQLPADPHFDVKILITSKKALAQYKMEFEVYKASGEPCLFTTETEAFSGGQNTEVTLNQSAFSRANIDGDDFIHCTELTFYCYLKKSDNTREKIHTIAFTMYSVPHLPLNSWDCQAAAAYDPANVQYLWSRFLDFMILMEDRSYPTSAEGYLQKIFLCGITYDGDLHFIKSGDFKLQNFLQLYENKQPIQFNCTDCAFFTQFSLAFWHNLKILFINHDFNRNPIVKIGTNAFDQGPFLFTEHYLNAVRGNTDGLQIIDLCLKVNASANPSNPNPAIGDARLPFLMPYQVYREQTVLKREVNYPGGYYKESLIPDGTALKIQNEIEADIKFVKI